MKRISILLCSLAVMFNAITQTYTPTNEKQAVNFSIKNFGLIVEGSFTGLVGSIVFDPANLTAASFKVSVDASTINTGNKSRDGHLNKEEYFNTATYEKITLVSNKITNGTVSGTYIFEGILNIKGTNKSITFPFTVSPNSQGYLFSGSFKINRRDFKIGGSSLILSDNLTVMLKVSAKRN